MPVVSSRQFAEQRLCFFEIERVEGFGEPAIRDATSAEHHAAEQMVGPACRAADLVPIRSTVAILTRPDTARHPGRADPWRAGETMQHLVVLIIGRRWVHASTHRQPGQQWYIGPIDAV
jgi:hypothetical protein